MKVSIGNVSQYSIMRNLSYCCRDSLFGFSLPLLSGVALPLHAAMRIRADIKNIILSMHLFISIFVYVLSDAIFSCEDNYFVLYSQVDGMALLFGTLHRYIVNNLNGLFMEVKGNFESIPDDTLVYITLKYNDIRLQLVEILSLLCGRLLLYFAVSFLAALAFLFLMVAVALFLSTYIGMPAAVIVVALMLVVMAIVIYSSCRKLCIDKMVKFFCGIMFAQEGKSNG